MSTNNGGRSLLIALLLVVPAAGCVQGPLCDLGPRVLGARAVFSSPIDASYEIELVSDADAVVHARAMDGELELEELVLDVESAPPMRQAAFCQDGELYAFGGGLLGECGPDGFTIPTRERLQYFVHSWSDGVLVGEGPVEYEPLFENGDECPANGHLGTLEIAVGTTPTEPAAVCELLVDSFAAERSADADDVPDDADCLVQPDGTCPAGCEPSNARHLDVERCCLELEARPFACIGPDDPRYGLLEASCRMDPERKEVVALSHIPSPTDDTYRWQTCSRAALHLSQVAPDCPD